MKTSIRNEGIIKSLLQEKKLRDDEDPFYIVDVGDTVLKWKEWKEVLPGVEPFYAVKCNPDPVLLHVLSVLGVNFDCSSQKEIEAVLKCGVNPARIIYANTCKGPSHLKYADSVGVDLMTFDNEEELYKVKSRFPDARLVLRIKVDDSGAILKLSRKFGADISEVPHLLDVAKDLTLNVVGVSFHVGCNCQDPLAFHKAIGSAKDVFNLARDRGFQMNLLDIGGGFPGHRDTAISFVEFSSAINDSLEVYFPPSSGVRIIAEPGRYFMSTAFTLLTNVIGKRQVTDNNNSGASTMYFINEGVYGAFNNLIYHNTKWKPTPITDSEDRKMRMCSIWGPTCDSVDCLYKNFLLPDMSVGDWVAFENMGSYTTSCASNFNGFDITRKKYFISAQILSYFQQLSTWHQMSEVFNRWVTQY